jgi:hypothetical protein
MSADGTPAPKRRRKMPAQKPATSEQVVGTPRDFIIALEYRFGPLAWDLCATKENSVVPGRFFDVERDGLKQDWGSIDGNLYCNPEFGDIPRWLKKAVEEATPRSRVFVLTPASLDANWWWDFVRPHAITYALSPRLKFVGHAQAAPKGLALHWFGLGATGLGRFRWKETLEKARAAEIEPSTRGMIECADGDDMVRKLKERGLVKEPWGSK